MAEEGPGARRLSPHNKDPSLVTSYLPPNLQKAPCVPYKAPAPAACSAARRDGGSGGGPPPLPPGPPPPAPPLRGRAARRGRSRPRPAPAAAVPSGPRCAAPRSGWDAGTPGYPRPRRLLSPLSAPTKAHPADSKPWSLPSRRRREPRAEPRLSPGPLPPPQVHLRRPAPDGAATARPLRGCPCRSRPP